MINTISSGEKTSTKEARRELTFYQSLNEAVELAMEADPTVYIMGLGVPDPKGVFGTTLGLQSKFGPGRVMDIPTSENAMTGVAIGSALVGMRPIMVHQRLDFALLAMEQIVNQAANWHYMYGGKASVPLVIRLIVGRGWGQGPQHSQSLHSWFAHIPGLKVVAPTTAYDAKGILIASIEDGNPVIFIEHRWLHNTKAFVPEGPYRVPLGKSKIIREGRDLTIIALSYMSLEALRASQILADCAIDTEVIDVRSIRPLDDALILDSVRKTGRLIVADAGWSVCGFSAEIIARVAESGVGLRVPPKRIHLPDSPSPSSPGLSKYYYPRAADIVDTARLMFGFAPNQISVDEVPATRLDVPDPTFTGPF